MALKIVGNMLGNYHGKIKDDIYMTDSEAAVVGRGYYLSSGRWTKAATTNAIEAVCIKAATAGTNVYGTMELVKAGDIIEADYTGTPNVAFLVGLSLAVLDANGENVDSATVTGGHSVIVSKDTTNTKVQIVPRKTFTNN